MAEKIVFEAAKKATDDARMRNPAEEKGVIEEIDKIIAQAAEAGALAIHFEPSPEGYAVRIRQGDGAMQKITDVPDRLKANVANRIKVLSGMDITKGKIPQNGYFKITVGERKIELNVFTLPTLYGEAIVVRISYKVSATMRLAQMGMNPAVLQAYQKALARGSGLFLVTGPPGSGKRTTVYASILETFQPTQLAMGYDPVVKYEIPGMIQGKPEEKSEFTFAEAIRSIMKQEPDIAYVGEVALEPEARATIQGAFAKRYVYARMMANDSVSVLQNIVDIGIQPFLLVASLAAVINQRLVRRLCPDCKQAFAADAALIQNIGLRLPPETKFYKAGPGCPKCAGTGYLGKMALYELFRPSEEISKMIVAKSSVQEIRAKAFGGPNDLYFTLKGDGIWKAMAGHCSLEDVLNCL